jgi:hypothetical protein
VDREIFHLWLNWIVEPAQSNWILFGWSDYERIEAWQRSYSAERQRERDEETARQILEVRRREAAAKLAEDLRNAARRRRCEAQREGRARAAARRKAKADKTDRIHIVRPVVVDPIPKAKRRKLSPRHLAAEEVLATPYPEVECEFGVIDGVSSRRRRRSMDGAA